jgi:hypothetical protein
MNEIDLHVSLSRCRHAACWKRYKGQESITLYLPEMFRECKATIDKWRGYECPDPEGGGPPCACHEMYIQALVGNMVFSYLSERVCLERAHQGIRLCRDKCKPCAIAGVTDAMFAYIINRWELT